MKRGTRSLSLVQRLTLWYAAVFAVCFLVVLAVFFFLMQDVVSHWADEELIEKVEEIRKAFDPRHPEWMSETLTLEEREEKGNFLGRIGKADGTLLIDASSGELRKVLFRPESTGTGATAQSAVETIDLGRNRAVRTLHARLADGWILQLGLAVTRAENWMEEFLLNLMKVAGLAVVLGLAGGALVAYRGLAPVREMASRVAEIDGRSLDAGLPITGRGDEVDRLAQAFNQMLRRIATLVQGLREVTDTVAHDLRTPVAGIRGMAEIALRKPRAPGDYQRVLYQIMDKLDVLLALFHSILDVAEADGGALAIQRDRLNLGELFDDLQETFEPVAESSGIRLHASASDRIEFAGDSRRLFQALSNLLDNAIKYTNVGGEIRLQGRLNPSGRGLVITVTDSGCGISEDDLPHIFERYYRGRAVRHRQGSGLGLPLVRAIVRAHAGRITVASEPGGGTTFRIELPTADSGARLGTA